MKKWTLLVFLAADNDLGQFAIRTLHAMEHIGSTNDVNVVVQVALYGDGAKGKSLRGQVVANPNWKPYTMAYTSPLIDIGDTNTGDPSVLTDFAVWAVEHFPAEQYGLVIWGHGSGWKEDFIYQVAQQTTSEPVVKAMRAAKFADRYADHLRRIIFRRTAEEIVSNFINFTLMPEVNSHIRLRAQASGLAIAAVRADQPSIDAAVSAILDRAIALDQTHHDSLDSLELKKALSDAIAKLSASQRKRFVFDLVGFDACLMAGIEVIYQCRETCGVIVGSEDIEPGIGWNYDAVIQFLCTSSGVATASDLGVNIVKDYIDGLSDYRIRLVTQSCLRLSQVSDIVSNLDDLGTLITSMLSAEYAIIAQCEKQGTRFFDTDYLDLGDFVSRLKTMKVSPVLDKLDVSIRAFVTCSSFLFPSSTNVRPTGLSVYFPTKPEYDSAYSILDITAQVPNWVRAIKAYHFLPLN